MIKIDNYKLQSELVVDENNKNDKENDMFIFIEDENEILEHIKMEDNFLKNIDIKDRMAYDFENNLLVSGQDQPFNEKSYYEMLNKNNSIDNFDDFVVSEQDQPFNQESYFNDFLVSEQESSFNEVSYLNSIESTLYELNSDISLNGLEDDAILENFESNLDDSLENEIKNKEILTSKNDDEIISNNIFSQPEFEEYTIITENDILQQDIDKDIIGSFDISNESNINELPTINVDDKVNFLYNFDFNDLDELNKVDFNTFSTETSKIDILDNIQEFKSNVLPFEEIITECIPPSEIHDYTIIEDEPTKLSYEVEKNNDFNVNLVDSIQDESHIDLSSLLNKNDIHNSNEFDNIPLVKTSDSIVGINYEMNSPNVQFNSEENSLYDIDIPLVKKNDYVNTVDYSNYSVYGYVQPETVVVNNHPKNESNYNNEVDSIKLENIINESYSNYNSSINQSFISVESKEVICKSKEIPTVEEQMKKIKRPNLFRKYSVASAANLVILKSIDRLLNITESAMKRNNKDWNDK